MIRIKGLKRIDGKEYIEIEESYSLKLFIFEAFVITVASILSHHILGVNDISFPYLILVSIITGMFAPMISVIITICMRQLLDV